MQSISQVSVVAGGWSFTKVPHDRLPGYVIAVNDSAFYLKRKPNEIVSMDRLWTEYRWNWLCEQEITTCLRRGVTQNLPNLDLTSPPLSMWLSLFECDHESTLFVDDDYGPNYFARYPTNLNGTNSGMCGLNRAWQLRPDELFLCGFDMQLGPNGEKHWHPDYPYGYTTPGSKFRQWAREFDHIAEQFKAIGTKVWNVSDRSLIKVFPTMRVEDLPRPKSALARSRFAGLDLR